MRKIKTKARAFDLYMAGGFGTRLQSWFGLDTFPKDFFSAPHRRAIMRVLGQGCGPVYDNIRSMNQLYCLYARLRFAGYGQKHIWIGEQAPNDKIIIQGHLYNCACEGEPYNNFDVFEYTTRPMNLALSHRKGFSTMRGLRTRLVLKDVMSPCSWEDFNILLGLYPNHVLEFSVFDCYLGHLPKRNAIVWEIRQY
jgi:hypothetical protein